MSKTQSILINERPSNKRTIKREYSSMEILEGLRAKDNLIVRYIYRKFYAGVQHFILNNSGFGEDAEDIFQDALVIIYKNIQSDHFKLECAFNTYLVSICRHLWFRRLSKMKLKRNIPEDFVVLEQEDSNIEEDARRQADLIHLVTRHFQRMDVRSRQLFNLFIQDNSHKEIARIMGYSSENYSKTRKCYFKQKLRRLIEKDPLYKQLRVAMLDN